MRNRAKASKRLYCVAGRRVQPSHRSNTAGRSYAPRGPPFNVAGDTVRAGEPNSAQLWTDGPSWCWHHPAIAPVRALISASAVARIDADGPLQPNI